MKELDIDRHEAEQHAVERLRHSFEFNRRELFKLLGAGLVVGVYARTGLAQESGRAQSETIPQDLDSWLHIAGDGRVTVLTGKVEIGQNIRTSLAQQVAEELHAPMESIALIMGDTDLTPFDMGTFGSRTTPQMGSQLRNVSVQAREMLIDLAARHWQTDRALLSAQNGAIVNSRNGQKISYGELTQGQKLVKILDADPALTPATEWRIAGSPAPKVEGKAFVTGAHQYSSDVMRPGMLYAVRQSSAPQRFQCQAGFFRFQSCRAAA
jgi:isoquinoline 1-oxidoreductase